MAAVVAVGGKNLDRSSRSIRSLWSVIRVLLSPFRVRQRVMIIPFILCPGSWEIGPAHQDSAGHEVDVNKLLVGNIIILRPWRGSRPKSGWNLNRVAPVRPVRVGDVDAHSFDAVRVADEDRGVDEATCAAVQKRRPFNIRVAEDLAGMGREQA